MGSGIGRELSVPMGLDSMRRSCESPSWEPRYTTCDARHVKVVAGDVYIEDQYAPAISEFLRLPPLRGELV